MSLGMIEFRLNLPPPHNLGMPLLVLPNHFSKGLEELQLLGIKSKHFTKRAFNSEKWNISARHSDNQYITTDFE